MTRNSVKKTVAWVLIIAFVGFVFVCIYHEDGWAGVIGMTITLVACGVIAWAISTVMK